MSRFAAAHVAYGVAAELAWRALDALGNVGAGEPSLSTDTAPQLAPAE